MGLKTNFDTEYVHYGANEFIPEKVTEDAKYWRKNSIGKPSGLWASPLNAELNWKDWCEEEDFHTERLDESFKFKLKNGSRILEVHQIEDILLYVVPNNFGFRLWVGSESKLVLLNRDALMSDFDGMELYLSENWLLRDMYFYTWDCDSICIWNSDVIEVL